MTPTRRRADDRTCDLDRVISHAASRCAAGPCGSTPQNRGIHQGASRRSGSAVDSTRDHIDLTIVRCLIGSGVVRSARGDGVARRFLGDALLGVGDGKPEKAPADGLLRFSSRAAAVILLLDAAMSGVAAVYLSTSSAPVTVIAAGLGAVVVIFGGRSRT